jgi:hypothetical protein
MFVVRQNACTAVARCGLLRMLLALTIGES